MTLLSLFMLILILYGVNRILDRSDLDPEVKTRFFYTSLLVITGWFILISILSYLGVLSNFDSFPPRPVFLIFLPLPFIIYFSFTSTFRKFAQTTPKSWFVNIQSFRILVEIILWMMFLAGQLPVQMTFEGNNFDVLVGLTAFPATWLFLSRGKYKRTAAIIWNICGLLLLLNILVIAVLSMPTPMRYFMNEPANTIVATFPYALLPGILVTIAYSMHIFSLRQLFLQKD